jgi:ring-1,2-phenylacetyl-CoA epoxidase subunit PaaB
MSTPALKEWPLWEVFVRSKQGLEHKHCGSLHASDAQHALQMARDVYTRRQEGVSIWVVPSAASPPATRMTRVSSSSPAADKIYRHPPFTTSPTKWGTCDGALCSPIDYLLHLADNALVLGQRNAEWCGHGPVLEEDMPWPT